MAATIEQPIAQATTAVTRKRDVKKERKLSER